MAFTKSDLITKFNLDKTAAGALVDFLYKTGVANRLEDTRKKEGAKGKGEFQYQLKTGAAESIANLVKSIEA